MEVHELLAELMCMYNIYYDFPIHLGWVMALLLESQKNKNSERVCIGPYLTTPVKANVETLCY